MPSLMNVPITRLVKNPRLSLTTIGVFLICLAKSSARKVVSSLVFSPRMISTSGILSTGEKKCRPMKSSGRVTPSARPADRQRRGVRAEQRVGARHAARPPCSTCSLICRVLEHRLDHQVGARRRRPRLVGRVDQRQQRVPVLLARAPALDRLGDQLLAVALAALGRLQRDVLEHDLDPGLRADVGDRGAHHPGAEDDDLPRRCRRSASAAAAAVAVDPVAGRRRTPGSCSSTTWPVARSTK